MQIHISDTPGQVARDFADFFEAWLSKQEGSVNIALSGGSTPAVLFKLWAEDYKGKIDWEKVHFYWGDERCVPPSDEESNYKMANDLFLSRVGVPLSNIHRFRGEDDPQAEVGRYAAEITDNLQHVDGLPAFDLIMLGMGSDGHTASIFPHQIELLEATSVCALAQHPESGQFRGTLTGNVLNNARLVAFLVTGASKTDKVDAIINDKEEAKNYPAAHIGPKHGALHWFVDEKAAEGLNG